jgi:hypothetical protein
MLKTELLKEHVRRYASRLHSNQEKMLEEIKEREERKVFFSSFTREQLIGLSEKEFTSYMSRLWAMLVWGNKEYYVDKIIESNGFDPIKQRLADLIWGSDALALRWDSFRKSTKMIGPAMMSELLAHVHPIDCMVWNRRAYVGLDYLGVEQLPKYNHQVTGSKYLALCQVAKQIGEEMKLAGIDSPDLLAVDYFIWDELQVVEKLSQLHKQPLTEIDVVEMEPVDSSEENSIPELIHNEVRDKIANIGTWLGFKANIETRIAEGSKVDAVWEASIGNMGRVIYVFEVQTKGSIDSLMMNLLKARNNPAVQGLVAVSDAAQLEKIERQAKLIPGLSGSLRCWQYEEVLVVHESLEMVNESINKLRLVPESF